MQCNNIRRARAIVNGGEDYPDIHGEVLFCQRSNFVLVTASIAGLPRTDAGFYGFHIHEGDCCGGEGFSETGGHFNPENEPHPNHAGDLPPLLYCAGSAFLQVRTDRFSVRNIIGRTVVIHKGADDFKTQPSGDAGEKIACGIIDIV